MLCVYVADDGKPRMQTRCSACVLRRVMLPTTRRCCCCHEHAVGAAICSCEHNKFVERGGVEWVGEGVREPEATTAAAEPAAAAEAALYCTTASRPKRHEPRHVVRGVQLNSTQLHRVNGVDQDQSPSRTELYPYPSRIYLNSFGWFWKQVVNNINFHRFASRTRDPSSRSKTRQIHRHTHLSH